MSSQSESEYEYESVSDANLSGGEETTREKSFIIEETTGEGTTGESDANLSDANLSGENWSDGSTGSTTTVGTHNNELMYSLWTVIVCILFGR